MKVIETTEIDIVTNKYNVSVIEGTLYKYPGFSFVDDTAQVGADLLAHESTLTEKQQKIIGEIKRVLQYAILLKRENISVNPENKHNLVASVIVKSNIFLLSDLLYVLEELDNIHNHTLHTSSSLASVVKTIK